MSTLTSFALLLNCSFESAVVVRPVHQYIEKSCIIGVYSSWIVDRLVGRNIMIMHTTLMGVEQSTDKNELTF